MVPPLDLGAMGLAQSPYRMAETALGWLGARSA